MHKECVATALIGYGRLSVGLVDKYVRLIQELVDRCLCPRCGWGPKAEWEHVSRVVGDGCLRICGECADHEGIEELRSGVVPPIVTWPTLVGRAARRG